MLSKRQSLLPCMVISQKTHASKMRTSENLGTFRVTHTFGSKTWIADLENEEGTHRKLYWSPSDESFSIS